MHHRVTYDFVNALFSGITKVFKILPRPYKERSFIQICCKSTIHDLFCLFVFDNWVHTNLGWCCCMQTGEECGFSRNRESFWSP